MGIVGGIESAFMWLRAAPGAEVRNGHLSRSWPEGLQSQVAAWGSVTCSEGLTTPSINPMLPGFPLRSAPM